MPHQVSTKQSNRNADSRKPIVPQKRQCRSEDIADAQVETGTEGCRCGPCNQNFTTRRAHLRHLRENPRHCDDTAQEQERHDCSICGKAFSRSWDRDRHQQEQHENRKGTCSSCGKRIRRHAPHKNFEGVQCYPHNNAPAKIAQSQSASIDVSTEVPDGIVRPLAACDGMCFSSIAEKMSRLSIGPPPCVEVHASQVRAAKAKRPLPCGLCGKAFELHNSDVLFEHLKDHFTELNSKNRCDVCEIGFIHEADLKKHQASAAQGDCGFRFQHKERCPGHHKPSFRYPNFSRPQNDDDRFSFSYRVRAWEYFQLKAFMQSVDRIAPLLEPKTQSDTTKHMWFQDCRECGFIKKYSKKFDLPEDLCERADSCSGRLLCKNKWEPSTITFVASGAFQSLKNFSKCLHRQERRDRAASFSEGSYEYPSSRDVGKASCAIQLQPWITQHMKEPYKCLDWTFLEDRQRLLYQGVAAGDVELSGLALAQGADPNGSDLYGTSPLHLAIASDSPKLVDMLIRHGGSLDLSFLIQIKKQGSFQVAKMLEQRIYTKHAEQQSIGVEVAIEIFEILLMAAHDLPLSSTGQSIHVDSLGLAVYFGASIEYIERRMQSVTDLSFPLDVAVRIEREDVVNLLIDQGAKLKTPEQGENELKRVLKLYQDMVTDRSVTRLMDSL